MEGGLINGGKISITRKKGKKDSTNYQYRMESEIYEKKLKDQLLPQH